MKIVVISDTHNQRPEIPDGDVLIHCGDATMMGTFQEVGAFNEWLGTLPHPTKLFCAGNHDWLFARDRALAVSLLSNARYVEDELIEVGGLQLYASPWTPSFQRWAFMQDRGRPIREKWDLITEGVDILVTHGPPFGILDPGIDLVTRKRVHAGCEELLDVVQRIEPRYHLFGHLHEGYGQVVLGKTTFLNAAMVDDNYRLTHQATVIDA